MARFTSVSDTRTTSSDELPQEGIHFFRNVRNRDAVTDGMAFYRYGFAGFEAGVKRWAARRLDTYHSYRSLERLEGASDARNKPTASYGNEDRLHIRAIGQDLETDAPMSGHDVPIGPGIDVGVRLGFPTVLAEITEEIGHRDQNRCRTIRADRIDLGVGGGVGHEASRRHAKIAGRPGKRLRGVSGAHRAQPALSFLLCEAGDGIEDAP